VRDNREVLQQRILDGQPVNVDGYEIGRDLFQSCARPDLLTPEPKAHAGPALVMQIAASPAAKQREDLKALAQAYPAGHFQRAAEQPFWREIKPFYGRAAHLQQATLDWLEQVDA